MKDGVANAPPAVAKALVVVSNLDVVKPKNLYQSSALPEYEFLFVSYGGIAPGAQTPDARTVRYPRSWLRRSLFYFQLLRRNKRRLHHVELYTGNGGFVGMEFLLARMLAVPVVIAERGALLQYSSTSPVRRFVLRLLYRFADEIWLRERWMPAALANIVRRETFFNFNALDISHLCAEQGPPLRDIDFLWVNSFKPWRHPARFCQAFNDPRLAGLRVDMMGLLDATSAAVLAQQQLVKATAAPNVQLHRFGDPRPFYRRAKFFVLPADIVFLNFALLEAMAWGAVPLIADVDGAQDIIDHGVDGFIFPHNPAGLLHGLLHACNLDDVERQAMADRAKAKIASRFSSVAWAHNMRSLYGRLSVS